MPAILPARLKLQVDALCASINQPEVFIRQLHYILDQYADRTHRQGQSGTPNPLLSSFNVPPPVLRQIINSLRMRVEGYDTADFLLSDSLWEEPYLEYRTLAAHLTGWVKQTDYSSIIDRISNWLDETNDDQMIQIVVEHGLAQARKDAPQAVLILAQRWLQSNQLRKQKCGLVTLTTLVDDPDYPNLPALFLLVSPFLRKTPIELRPIMVGLINSMAQRSPQETSYLLQESLRATDNPDSAWLIRQLLAGKENPKNDLNPIVLPEDLHNNLRKSLRNLPTPPKT